MDTIETLNTGLHLIFMKDFKKNTIKLYNEVTLTSLLKLTIFIAALGTALFYGLAVFKGGMPSISSAVMFIATTFAGFLVHILLDYVIIAGVVTGAYFIIRTMTENVEFTKLYFFGIAYHIFFLFIFAVVSWVMLAIYGNDGGAQYLEQTGTEHLFSLRIINYFAGGNLVVMGYYVVNYLFSLIKLSSHLSGLRIEH